MTIFALFLLALLTFIYNGYIIYKIKDIPESISQTSYIYGELNGKNYLFTCFCLIVVIILFPIWITFSEENFRAFVFLSCLGILFAGATPFFKESFQKPIHYISGLIVVVMYVIWLILSGYIVLLFAEIILTLICILFDKKNYVFYIEIIGLNGLIILLIVNSI